MKPRLKVMHLISSVSVGGAERTLLDLAKNSNREHFEVHVCNFGSVRGVTFLDDFSGMGIPFIQISSARFYDLKNLSEVIRYIREQKIDIIHTHLTEADILGRIAGMLTRTPVVTTIQNEPRRFMELRADKRILNFLTAKYLTTHLVSVSGFLREQFITDWNIKAEDISTIHNSADVDLYVQAPVERRHKPDAPKYTITTVGRLSKQKAHHILLKAAQKVVSRFPDVQFLFVGQGELETDLKALTQELGLQKNIVFTGVRRDVADILASSDIFVLSSLWEGLPLSAVEAMASGCATVLTDVGGNRELIEHGKNGMIVPPNDSDALAEAMITLLEQDDLRLSLARAARERILEEFTLALMVQRYEELYQRVWTKLR